jgi:hypothetical protein
VRTLGLGQRRLHQRGAQRAAAASRVPKDTLLHASATCTLCLLVRCVQSALAMPTAARFILIAVMVGGVKLWYAAVARPFGFSITRQDKVEEQC